VLAGVLPAPLRLSIPPPRGMGRIHYWDRLTLPSCRPAGGDTLPHGPVLALLVSSLARSLLRSRRFLLVAGLLLAVAAIVLATFLASSTDSQTTEQPTEVVVRLEPTNRGEPTVVQPILVQWGSSGGAGLWVTLLSALGGLLSGVGAMAQVWVRADKDKAASTPSDDGGRTPPDRDDPCMESLLGT
jgi:hypothetical protein